MLRWIARYIFSILYKLIYFSLSLNPSIHSMRNAPNILCPRSKEQKESQPYFIFYCKLAKITLDFSSKLINLKYAFNIAFKITLKTIIMGTSSQFHDGAQLNILLTLSSDILLLTWAQKKLLWRQSLRLKNNGTLKKWKPFWFICYNSCLLVPGVNTPLYSLDILQH